MIRFFQRLNHREKLCLSPEPAHNPKCPKISELGSADISDVAAKGPRAAPPPPRTNSASAMSVSSSAAWPEHAQSSSRPRTMEVFPNPVGKSNKPGDSPHHGEGGVLIVYIVLRLNRIILNHSSPQAPPPPSQHIRPSECSGRSNAGCLVGPGLGERSSV